MDVIPNDQYILELILLVWAIDALVIIITQARNTFGVYSFVEIFLILEILLLVVLLIAKCKKIMVF
ncbi:hypothetical protein RCC94_03520 [Exiguobacterium acetylicum]|uniref:hypothetical protein n=1 Tax=Exiguobacterium acetylicum TaxID=41170 RepID=UPI0027DF4229|nr:hypothetical protein [Exiguobacterium acetylicum]MDQ6466539.1 hypothetical protein [Exiguobacterium acetylicum]